MNASQAELIQQDVRHACRLLWRARTFTTAAVVTLAVGIAGTTLMFALIQGVLLRPLPVRDQARLIVAWKEIGTAGSARYPFGDREIHAVAEFSQLVESAAGVTRNGVARTVVSERGRSSYANVGLVTGGFFEVLGAEPVLGRALTVADEKSGVEPVVVISSGLWERRYGSARDVLGRRIVLGEQPFTIVGVMPPDLDYPSGVEIWRTTSSVPADGPFGNAARREVNLVARLRPGVTVPQAASELTALSRQTETAIPAIRGLVPVVRPFADVVIGDARKAILALFGAVALVLLIASANVANLLLMRGEARRGEVGLRIALGASRSRIVRQVLAESLILSVLAGIAGVVITWWSLPALVTLVPDGLPRAESVSVGPYVVLFAIGVTFITATLAGLIPGVVTVRADLMSPLRGGSTATASDIGTRGRRLLVVTQVALAVTVLAASGLLIRSVMEMQSIDLGLPADRLVLLDVYMPQPKYVAREQYARFLDDVMTQLEATPAVAAATPVNVSPFSNQGWDVPQVTVEGQSAGEAAANPSLNLESVHPNYFAAFEIPLTRGRPFTTVDREGALPVAIVSDDLAMRLWPSDDPIGKRLKMGPVGSTGRWLEVVGVAATTRYRTVTAARPTLYLPAAQFQMTARMLVVRSSAPLELLTALAHDRIEAADADAQLMRVAPFAELLDRPLARPRFNAVLLAIFGLTALLLAAIGLYAVMAAYVRQRGKEIAVRIALGASAAAVRRFVMAEAVRLAGLGAIAGLAGALVTSRFLRSMLFETSPLDPLALVGAASLLACAAALASYAPLRRATRADVAATLRSQ